ncbi:MAG: hypothetical protein EOO28_13165 [Comamonadaceae bacterium]|nr:MAG: hypothetical protein EOO28_13165 [Comamonadaceae bacterium]
MNFARISLSALMASTLAFGLAGCDEDSTSAATPAAPVSAAPLVVSGATPSTANGTLDKATGIGESGISDATGNFSSGGPNNYCRAAVYALTNSGDGRKYVVQVVFDKTTRAVTYVSLAEDAASPSFMARANAGLASVAVDIANRRIGFTATALTGANPATLNGSLEYVTNGSVADRANCG